MKIPETWPIIEPRLLGESVKQTIQTNRINIVNI